MSVYSNDDLIKLYLGDSKSQKLAHEFLYYNDVDILKSNTLLYHHISYCINNGFYNEAISLSEKAIKKYPLDKNLKELTNPILNNNYDEKSKKYNKKKKTVHDYFDDCCCYCDCCDTCDCFIDFGKYDGGCIDFDDICFCDC